MKAAELKADDHFLGEVTGVLEPEGEEADFADQGVVRDHASYRPEEHLEVVGQLRASGIPVCSCEHVCA